MRFSKLANKNVLLDIPTNSLLSSLKGRRIEQGLSINQLAKKLSLSWKSIRNYEQRKYPPCLLNLINMAEFFSYDLSDSLNYKFFHGLIRADRIRARMKSIGLTGTKLARLTGYSSAVVNAAIRLNEETSIFCLNAVLNALDNAERR